MLADKIISAQLNIETAKSKEGEIDISHPAAASSGRVLDSFNGFVFFVPEGTFVPTRKSVLIYFQIELKQVCAASVKTVRASRSWLPAWSGFL